jgi:DNA-sulfur modification-associated
LTSKDRAIDSLEKKPAGPGYGPARRVNQGKEIPIIDRTLQVIPINDYEAVAAMTVADVLELAVPARYFLPNAKLSPLDQRVVDRLRDLHALIQRDFAGAKKTNAQGPLAEYIRDEWLPTPSDRPPAGFLPPFILFLPDKLDIDDTNVAHIRSKGVFGDGESRGDALLVNVENLSNADGDRLLDKRVAVHIVHGVSDTKVLAKYFADVNGRGVRVNPNLTIMADYTDPYAETTMCVFERLDLELEKRQRQVPAKSNAILTGLQARMMVAAVAKGVAAVQYGAKPIPTEGVEFTKLEQDASAWLQRVFAKFDANTFRDKAYIVRSVPVSVCLGALGRAFYSGDTNDQRDALAVLSDDGIDWTIGQHWSGIAGKVNPDTGRFAVGGGKEYAYATWRALTEPDSDAGKQIRHIATAAAA